MPQLRGELGRMEAAELALRTESKHTAGWGPRLERQPQTSPGGWTMESKSENPPGRNEEKSREDQSEPPQGLPARGPAV